MNRHFLILMLSYLAFCQPNAFASQDSQITQERNNIKLRYWRFGGDGSEYISQVNILLDILQEFSKKICKDSTFFYIHLGYNEKPIYNLSYEEIDFLGYNKYEEIFLQDYGKARDQHQGIKLSFVGPELNYSDILKALYFGITNQELIMTLQKVSLTDNLYWYPFVLKPMINAKLKQLISNDNPIVSEVLNKRFYRVFTRDSERNDSVNYYYQDSQFHIYKTKGPNPRNGQVKDADTSGKTLGSFKNIVAINSDMKNHYLILVNPFCFYHLVLNSEEISGTYCAPYLLTPEIWQQQLVLEQNKIRIHRALWGDFLFDFVEGLVTIDSGSILPQVKEGMAKERNYKIQTLKEKLKWQIDLRRRRVNGLLMIIAAILVNIYLAKFKK